MRPRFVAAIGFVALCASMLAMPAAAWAGDGYGQSNYSDAQASGGQLTVEAGHTYWSPPSGSSFATEAQSDPPPGKPDPNQPYGCTYLADPEALQTLGPGGATPGEWMIPTCAGPGVIDPMPPFWVTNAQAQAVAVQVNPVVVAEEAAKQLAFGSPSIDMAPPAGSPQLVGVATWLWINPAAWKNLTATATAGTVTTTATATPTRVVWNMGDGNTVTCDGPGTPYSSSDPNGTTDCSYTWPSAGSFQVRATVYWSVTWTAVGAAGGGNLGVQAGPASVVPVTVTESQAINTPGSGGN